MSSFDFVLIILAVLSFAEVINVIILHQRVKDAERARYNLRSEVENIIKQQHRINTDTLQRIKNLEGADESIDTSGGTTLRECPDCQAKKEISLDDYVCEDCRAKFAIIP